jgi:hypothetical protein
MRTLVRTAVIAAGLTVVSAGAVNAQIPETLKFTTTFPFMVGNRTMPAGSYTATPLAIDHSLVELRSGHSAVLVLTEPDTPKPMPNHDEVIFARQGDIYVLRELWDAASVTGAEALPQHAKSVHKAR